jgi:hypothetical protein
MPTNTKQPNKLIINSIYYAKLTFLSTFRTRFPKNGQNKVLETKGSGKERKWGNGEMGKWGNGEIKNKK